RGFPIEAQNLVVVTFCGHRAAEAKARGPGRQATRRDSFPCRALNRPLLRAQRPPMLFSATFDRTPPPAISSLLMVHSPRIQSAFAALALLVSVGSACKDADDRLFDEAGVWSMTHYTL